MTEHKLDNVLVSKAMAGDSHAFDDLVLNYQHKMKNVVSRYIPDRQIAKDIVQETFIHAYFHLDAFKGDSSFYTWVCSIAINLSKNHLKMQR